jgi:ABC-2 type transport system permease protein
MAELASGGIAAPEPPIPASTQILAVAWLRWRIFANSMFRGRPKTTRQAVSFAFLIILRVIVWPFLALMVIGPVVGSGFWAWATMTHVHGRELQTLFAAITLGWQFIAVNGLNVAAAVSNFDPASLIRYPLRFGRYFVLRTLIGLMAPSTIVGCLSLLAAAIGIGIAKPSLALPALLVLAVYALMNIFLTRMIGAWMERWLANRRFREIFGVMMAFSAISLQFLSIQRYTNRAHALPRSWLFTYLQNPHASIRWLPPGYAASAILHAANPAAALAPFLALVACTALLAGVFAVRLRMQFHGEYLGDGTIPRVPASSRRRTREIVPQPVPSATTPIAGAAFPPIIAVCLRKEWLTFRGNSAQFIGLIIPLIFIVFLNHGQLATHPTLFLPGAIAYVILGALAGLYNVFGADGLGVQIYLLAPVRMRDVIVAKNISSLALIVTEAGLAWALVTFLQRMPIPLATQVSTVLWTVFVIALNLALGTLRSIQAPRRFVPGQVRQRRGAPAVPTNRTSSLLILLVLFGSMLLQAPVSFLCHYMNMPWLAAWIFGPLALAAVGAYALLLHNAERLVLAHRDVFAEELCKA